VYIGCILHQNRDVEESQMIKIMDLVKDLISSGKDLLITSACNVICEGILTANFFQMCLKNNIIDQLFIHFGGDHSYNTKASILLALCLLTKVADTKDIPILLDKGIVNIILDNYESFSSISVELIDALEQIASYGQDMNDEELLRSIFESDLIDTLIPIYEGIQDYASLQNDSLETSIFSLMLRNPYRE
jgi:hypothetical protein